MDPQPAVLDEEPLTGQLKFEGFRYINYISITTFQIIGNKLAEARVLVNGLNK